MAVSSADKGWTSVYVSEAVYVNGVVTYSGSVTTLIVLRL